MSCSMPSVSLPADRPAASSMRYSGLPSARARRGARSLGSSGRPSTASTRSPASSSRQSVERDALAGQLEAARPRRAGRGRRRARCRRRTRAASAAAEAGSTQCASSMTMHAGCRQQVFEEPAEHRVRRGPARNESSSASTAAVGLDLGADGRREQRQPRQQCRLRRSTARAEASPASVGGGLRGDVEQRSQQGLESAVRRRRRVAVAVRADARAAPCSSRARASSRDLPVPAPATIVIAPPKPSAAASTQRPQLASSALAPDEGRTPSRRPVGAPGRGDDRDRHLLRLALDGDRRRRPRRRTAVTERSSAARATSTVPGSARAVSRAARFVGSPMTV